MTNFFIIAGEVSGDRQAAGLVRALRERDSNLTFSGIGGDLSRDAGVKLLHHISQFAFLGFAEIVRHLPFIRSVLKEIETLFRKDPPGALILVDYPGFNLRVAKLAKKYGIPVVYYICPQLWAWGEKRVEKMRQYVDLPLVIFKFEKEFFAKRGITAQFVGHPMVDQLENLRPSDSFLKRNGLGTREKILGLFPGSRKKEVEKILPVMVQTVRRLSPDLNLQAVIGRAPHIEESEYRHLIPAGTAVRIIEENSHSLMANSHAALVASGTATLELGFLQKPMAVLYRVSPLTYLIGKKLVKLPNIALANIIAGERVVPEFIQNRMKPEKIADFVSKLWQDPDYYREIQQKLAPIKTVLGSPGASGKAADLILSFLKADE